MLKKWVLVFTLFFLNIIFFIPLSESQTVESPTGIYFALGGGVLDENKQPLSGVQVVIKGTDIKTVTDYSGFYFFINPPLGKQTLQYFLVGYETKEVKVELETKGESTIHRLGNVKMKPVSISEPIPTSDKKEIGVNAYSITIKDNSKLVFPNTAKYSVYNRDKKEIIYRTVFTKQDEPVEVYDNAEVIYTLPFGSGTRNEKRILRYERGGYTEYKDYGILIRVYFDNRKTGETVALSPAQKEIVPGVVRIAKPRRSVSEGIVGVVFKKADQKIKEGNIADAVYEYYELLKDHYDELDENERLIAIYKIAELDYRSLGMLDKVIKLNSAVKFSDNVIKHLMFLKGVSFLNKDVEKITIDDCKNSLGFFESVKNFDGKIPDGVRLGRINSGDSINLLTLIAVEECAATILIEDPDWKDSNGRGIVEIGEKAFNQHLNEAVGEGQRNWVKIGFANFLTIIVRNEVQAGVFKSSNFEKAKKLYQEVVDFYGKQGVVSDRNIKQDKYGAMKGKRYILNTAQIGLSYLENGVEIYTNSMLKTLFKQAEENVEKLKAEKAPKTLFSIELLDPGSEYYLFSLDKGVLDFSISFSEVLLRTINPGIGFRELVRGNILKLSSDTMKELDTAENLGRIGVCSASMLRNEILCENAASITEALSNIKEERDLFVKKYKGAANIEKNRRSYYPDVDEKWLYSGKNICGEQRCEYLKTEDGSEFFIDPTDAWSFLKPEPTVNIGDIGEKIGWIFGNANPVMKAAVEREALAREKGIYLDKQRVDELTLKMACDYRKLGLFKTALGLLESIKDSDVNVECSFYTGTKRYNVRDLLYEIEGEGVFNLADETINGLISYDTASSIIVVSPVWVYGANKINQGMQLLVRSRAGEKVTLTVSKGFLDGLQRISSSYSIVRASILGSLKGNKILFKGGNFVVETSEKSFELAGKIAEEVFEEVVGESLGGVHPLLGAVGEMAVGSKRGLSAATAKSFAMRNLNYQFGKSQKNGVGYNLEGKKVIWIPANDKVRITKVSEDGIEFDDGKYKVDNLLDLQDKIDFNGLKISDVRKDIRAGSKFDGDLNTELGVWLRYVEQDLFSDIDTDTELETSKEGEISPDAKREIGKIFSITIEHYTGQQFQVISMRSQLLGSRSRNGKLTRGDINDFKNTFEVKSKVVFDLIRKIKENKRFELDYYVEPMPGEVPQFNIIFDGKGVKVLDNPAEVDALKTLIENGKLEDTFERVFSASRDVVNNLDIFDYELDLKLQEIAELQLFIGQELKRLNTADTYDEKLRVLKDISTSIETETDKVLEGRINSEIYGEINVEDKILLDAAVAETAISEYGAGGDKAVSIDDYAGHVYEAGTRYLGETEVKILNSLRLEKGVELEPGRGVIFDKDKGVSCSKCIFTARGLRNGEAESGTARFEKLENVKVLDPFKQEIIENMRKNIERTGKNVKKLFEISEIYTGFHEGIYYVLEFNTRERKSFFYIKVDDEWYQAIYGEPKFYAYKVNSIIEKYKAEYEVLKSKKAASEEPTAVDVFNENVELAINDIRAGKYKDAAKILRGLGRILIINDKLLSSLPKPDLFRYTSAYGVVAEKAIDTHVAMMYYRYSMETAEGLNRNVQDFETVRESYIKLIMKEYGDKLAVFGDSGKRRNAVATGVDRGFNFVDDDFEAFKSCLADVNRC